MDRSMLADNGVGAARVEAFQPRYAADFARLNLAWIERYFEVEPLDRKLLADPETSIIARGGEIYFLLEGSRPVGTVAVIPRNDLVAEIHKMAVADDVQRRGYGARLMESALGWARRTGRKWVVLCTSTRLTGAIRLYRRYGFQTLPPGMDRTEASRCDVTMVLELGR